MEVAHAIRRPGLLRSQINLDGESPVVLASGQELRRKIVDWYETGLDEVITELGNCLDAEGKSVPFTRRRVILMDLLDSGIDPSTEKVKDREVLSYINSMRGRRAWGGTPELIAVACMTRRPVRVWQKDVTGKLGCKEEFDSPDYNKDISINLLFEGRKGRGHYSALISTEDKKQLVSKFGDYSFIKLLY